MKTPKRINHPFEFPFVVKQIDGFISVSVPDFEITYADTTQPYPAINKEYVEAINRLMLKAAKKVLEKLSTLDEMGKKHYRPASFIRQNITTIDNEGISTRQAALYLGVSEATIKRWTLSGKLSANVSLGGHRTFIKAELDRAKDLMSKR